MSTTTTVEEAVHAALAGVDDPEIHKPITELGMVKGVTVAADGIAHVGVYLTVAGCPMRETITSRVTDGRGAGAGRPRRARRAGRDERRAAHGVAPQPARRLGGAGDPVRPARLAHPRLLRGVGQGRGRQVVGHGQPGRGDGRARPVGGRRRRRHLRPLRAAHARHRRPAHQGREHDHAAAGARREGDLDRHVHAGQRRRGLARPDAAPRAAAVPRRRLLGRPGRAAARPPARHRRHRDLHRAAHARTPSCSWSPRRRRPRPRWPSARGRSRCRPGSASRAWSRTCRGWSCPTAPAWRCSGPAAGRPWPIRCRGRSARPCRCWARCRWRRGCASAATGAPRSCWPSRSTPAATALRRIADRLAVRARGLAGRSLNITAGMTAWTPPTSSAVELLAAYRARTLSPVEATSAVLARIARLDPRVNAFCLVDEAAALDGGPRVRGRWARGEPCGALDGVPVSIKDLLLTRGWPTLRGSRSIDPAGRGTSTRPSVARVREHGGVLVGKTTTPELGWKGVTDAPLHRGHRATRGTRRAPRAAPRAAARRPSRWAWRRSRSAPTAAARCASRRRSPASPRSSPRAGGCRSTRRARSARCRTSAR